MGLLDDFQFFDAPLKTFPFSRLKSRNDKIEPLATWALGLAPYIDNKITLAKYGGNPILGANDKIPTGCPFTYYGSTGILTATQNIGGAGLVGTIAPLVSSNSADKKPRKFSDIVTPYSAKSPIFYYTYKKLKNHSSFEKVNKLVRAYPILGYGTNGKSYYPVGTRCKPTCIATNAVRITEPESGLGQGTVDFLDELDKNEFGEWIYINSFELYDGATFPRKPVPYVLPTIFYTATSEWSILNWTKTNPAEFGRKFRNDLIIGLPFNPLYSAYINNVYQSPYTWTYQGYNNTFGGIFGDVYLGRFWYNSQNRNYMESPAGATQPPILMPGCQDVVTVYGWGTATPATTYNANNIKAIGTAYSFSKGTAGVTKATSDTGTTWVLATPRLLFRSVDAFEKICRDFGIVATHVLDDAENTPLDFLPDTDTGTVPDGGASSGYPTNNTGSIPNFPDNTTDIITENAPNVSALSSAGVYALTVTQAKNFLNWLMTDDFTQNISNLFNDKLSAVGDLKIMPFDIALHDSGHSVISDTLTVGNVTGQIGNYRIIDGYNTWVSGGEYKYTAYYGDFNDFEKCSYSLYIPYAGIVELNAGDVVNKTLKLSYAVDLSTGNATAVVYSNGVVIKTAAAVMGVSVPITSTNNNQRQLNNALTALSIGSGVLGGAISSIASGNPMPLVGSITGGIYRGVSNAMTNPLVTQHTGSFGNGTGLSLSQTAFLIITRQIIAAPNDYKSTVGIPATYRGKISEFVGSGFVSVSADKIDISCTQSERDEILSALSRGIYL